MSLKTDHILPRLVSVWDIRNGGIVHYETIKHAYDAIEPKHPSLLGDYNMMYLWLRNPKNEVYTCAKEQLVLIQAGSFDKNTALLRYLMAARFKLFWHKDPTTKMSNVGLPSVIRSLLCSDRDIRKIVRDLVQRSYAEHNAVTVMDQNLKPTDTDWYPKQLLPLIEA